MVDQTFRIHMCTCACACVTFDESGMPYTSTTQHTCGMSSTCVKICDANDRQWHFACILFSYTSFVTHKISFIAFYNKNTRKHLMRLQHVVVENVRLYHHSIISLLSHYVVEYPLTYCHSRSVNNNKCRRMKKKKTEKESINNVFIESEITCGAVTLNL